MVQVHPFKGVRPAKDLADKVAALPGYSKSQMTIFISMN